MPDTHLAVANQLEDWAGLDETARASLLGDNADRTAVLRTWFGQYSALRGLTPARRNAIANAVLVWADARDLTSRLGGVEQVIAAHDALVAAIRQADEPNRDFTSLASKALWLCYPDDVPIFDSFAQRALWVIAKLETNIEIPIVAGTEYAPFARVWMAIYDGYADALDQIDMQDYPFRVRVFDKILWLIGSPDYVIPE